jgi:hypothetical protein
MHQIPIQPKLSADQRQLLELYDKLNEQQRQSLLDYATFLSTRTQAGADAKAVESPPAEPLEIPRPREESVVKAIKRLSATYPMLQRELLLDETSSLMMSHVLQGRDAPAVIDDLEILFKRHYQLHLDQKDE